MLEEGKDMTNVLLWQLILCLKGVFVLGSIPDNLLYVVSFLFLSKSD